MQKCLTDHFDNGGTSPYFRLYNNSSVIPSLFSGCGQRNTCTLNPKSYFQDKGYRQPDRAI